MEGRELKEGKALVRINLIEPLVKGGMVRKRGQTVEDHQKMLTSLEARLAYMRADRLAALAEVVEHFAEGSKKNVWPAEVSIINWARRLQEPPASQSRLVRSYLQSGAGSAALAGGYVVELFIHLKKYGTPPNDFTMKGIREGADSNARRLRVIRDQIKDGRASPRDQDWLNGYMDTKSLCLDIIGAKQEGHAA